MASLETYLRKCPEAEQAPQTHYLLGEILYKQNRFAEALSHATRVIASTAETPLHQQALLLAAQAFLQLGPTDQAQTYLQRVLASGALTKMLPAALYWLGEIAFQHQRYDDAHKYYQRLLQEQPTGPYVARAQYSLGWLYRQLGDAAAALQAFSTFLGLALQHEFAPQARFAQAALLRETKQLTEVAEAFKKLAQEAPASLQDEALCWWAETAYELGQYAAARTVYQRLVTTHSQSTRVNASLYGWGWAEVQQSQCTAAVPPWETLLQRDSSAPQAPDVHYQLIDKYAAEGSWSALARTHQGAIYEQWQDWGTRLAGL
jgi:TolA-binding protein